MLHWLLELLGLMKPREGKSKKTKKQLIMERNKKVQRIMMNVRSHDQEREHASSTDRIRERVERIREKKERALQLDPKTWQERTHPEGRKKGSPEERMQAMRSRVRESRARAHTLWSGRGE